MKTKLLKKVRKRFTVKYDYSRKFFLLLLDKKNKIFERHNSLRIACTDMFKKVLGGKRYYKLRAKNTKDKEIRKFNVLLNN